MPNGLRWSEADYAAYLARPRVQLTTAEPPPPAPSVAVIALPPDRYKSQTERRFAQLLDVWTYEGKVKHWWYEPMKLRLADTCFFTPDFLVMSEEEVRLICYEVKGFWRDDARVKIKVAAQQYPCFSFIATQYKNGIWKYEQL